MIVARAPLAPCASHCSRDLKPGEYKRVPSSAEKCAVGYFLACPACRFVSAHSADDLNPVERTSKDAADRVVLMGAHGSVKCYACKRTIAIDGSDLVAIEQEG